MMIESSSVKKSTGTSTLIMCDNAELADLPCYRLLKPGAYFFVTSQCHDEDELLEFFTRSEVPSPYPFAWAIESFLESSSLMDLRARRHIKAAIS